MKLRRIVRSFPWRTTLIVALALGLSAFSSWAWFTWELPPLQRYYLRAYWASSTDENNSEEIIEVQWLELTAPGRKSRYCLNSDVDDPFSGSGVALSGDALVQGWTGIEESAPDPVRSRELEEFLRTVFFHGRSFREVVTEPVLYVCLSVLLALFLGWAMRDGIESEWSDVWKAVWEPKSVWDSGWDVSPYRPSILARIRKRITPGLAALNRTPERLRLLVVKRYGSAPHSRPDSPAASGHTHPSLSTDDPGRSMPPRISNPGSPARTNAEPNDQLVFPGSSPSYVRSKDADAWHESEWIE